MKIAESVDELKRGLRADIRQVAANLGIAALILDLSWHACKPKGYHQRASRAEGETD